MSTELMASCPWDPHAMASADRNLTNNGSQYGVGMESGSCLDTAGRGREKAWVRGTVRACAFPKRHVIKRAEAAPLTASGRMQRPRDGRRVRRVGSIVQTEAMGVNSKPECARRRRARQGEAL
jgi:hypothetical protein